MLRFALYARTVRFLTGRQLFYRVVRRFQRQLPPRHHPNFVESSTNQARMAEAVAGWGSGNDAERIRVADSVCEGNFTFLNQTRSLHALDWRHRYVSHLWNYNLHYFAFGVDLAWAFRITGDGRYAKRFAELASEWIDQTSAGEGDGWEPYPTSVRIINWSYALLLFGDRLPPGSRELIANSVYDQVAFLRRRVEYDIQANHLLKNFAALVIGSLMFAGTKPRRWGLWGARHLWRELEKQVLPDGTHFELSPMYHAIAMGDFLESAQLLGACGQTIPPEVAGSLQKMTDASGILSRTNGKLHLFNDSALGIGPDLDHLDRLSVRTFGRPLGFPAGAFSLPAAGYYGLRDRQSEDRILIDCGPPGPEFQPGHAHCDALSFELDIDGLPVVVDSGVSGYGGDPLREYVRSTRAHNTVMIDGQEQSEVWDTFRVARRISGIQASQSLADGVYRFAGEYRPYHSRSVLHRRTIERHGKDWLVVDKVDGAGVGRLQSFLHFDPAFTLSMNRGQVTAKSPSLEITIDPIGADDVSLARGASDPSQGWYCPEFGQVVPNGVLVLSRADNKAALGYRLTAKRSRPAEQTVG